ncbi:MAG: aminotransferase class I/II-fold pyridoxal phosphate-dependent enzyme [Anaerolineae bacterium]|jgi:cystathionine beta-lyase/cystathionine gamma-synthase|nr:aminotransferase class I/II-fold pyridoxal phosphate-dependent enzyme [Anaerolineae bacterium]
MQTKAVQIGTELAPQDVSPPLHMANTYIFESAEQAAHAFECEDQPIYTRWGNPTTEVMERKIAALEGAQAAIATASGMAAVASALMANVAAGDHIVATTGLYSGTYHFVTEDLPRYGVESTLAQADDPAAFEAALRPNTRVIYLESPGNPTLMMNDIAAIAAIAKAHGILTIIDNTFATPVNQRPIELGVDVVVHAATKFLGGHGDALGGAVVGSAAMIERVKRGPIRRLGGCISPFNAWLIARGISTLPLRMVRHNGNALRIAEWLAGHPQVAWVRYPWYPTHPQYKLARQQMPGGGGGVVVFELKGGFDAGVCLMDHVELAARTVSLGDVRTLLTHPASTTHHSVCREARLAAGITDGLIRFAVGIEDAEDIIDDLHRALAASA